MKPLVVGMLALSQCVSVAGAQGGSTRGSPVGTYQAVTIDSIGLLAWTFRFSAGTSPTAVPALRSGSKPCTSDAPSTSVLSLVMVDSQDQPPRFLLIVRERVRPESLEAYDRNEREIATACSRLTCPHPYLALVSVAGPNEVWWLNAFASRAEREQVRVTYARNQPLMTALEPLARRKEGLRDDLTTWLAEYQPELSRRAAWRVPGTRFFVLTVDTPERSAEGAVFESPDGQRFGFGAAPNREAADSMALSAGGHAAVLAVKPRWSFPASAWMVADPEFWRSRPASRSRQSRHSS